MKAAALASAAISALAGLSGVLAYGLGAGPRGAAITLATLAFLVSGVIVGRMDRQR